MSTVAVREPLRLPAVRPAILASLIWTALAAAVGTQRGATDAGSNLGLGWAHIVGMLLAGWLVLWLWAKKAEARETGGASACFLLALLASTLYFAVTPSDLRQYDAKGHLDYIYSIYAHSRIPRMEDGWESYHPPVFYVAASTWLKTVERYQATAPFGPSAENSVRDLQAFGWFAFLLTIAASAALWAKLDEPLHWFGAFALALIPGELFFSARINNDVLLPALGVAVLSGVLAYWRKPHATLALWIGIASALAMAIKLNGAALWVGALVCMILGSKESKTRHPFGLAGFAETSWLSDVARDWRRLLLAFLPGAVFLALWMAHSLHQTGSPLYTNFARLDPPLLVPNDAYRFLSFDYRAFLSQDGAHPWGEELRKSFLTYVTTTFLFGEFSFPERFLPVVTAARAAFLPILACLAFCLARARRHWDKPVFRASLVFAGAQFAFLIAMCVRQPASCTMDARYLAPAFFPIGVLFSTAVGDAAASDHAWLRAFARVGTTAFPLLIACFYGMLLF